ncbi:MAG: hypothetical protein ACT4PT_03315 [Methanobacteriota archaeon]
MVPMRSPLVLVGAMIAVAAAPLIAADSGTATTCTGLIECATATLFTDYMNCYRNAGGVWECDTHWTLRVDIRGAGVCGRAWAPGYYSSHTSAPWRVSPFCAPLTQTTASASTSWITYHLNVNPLWTHWETTAKVCASAQGLLETCAETPYVTTWFQMPP